jgi:thioredoxin reductase
MQVIEKEYVVLGAGPAGLQMGYHLSRQGRDYTILERGEVGQFFRVYPRHRKLISINKVHTGTAPYDVSMRWDWNSLLSDDEPFLLQRFTHEYFPNADSLVDYLAAYARRFQLSVECHAEVVSVEKGPNGFELSTRDGRQYRAQSVIVASGFAREYHPMFEGSEHVIPYSRMSTDREQYRNLRVMVLGKGNSAFETADHLVGHAAAIHVVSPEPLRLAWKTHYVGHLRAVNNNLLDTYQLKGQNSVQNAIIERIEKTPAGYDVTLAYTKTMGEKRVVQVDRVLGCTGFRMDSSIFAESSRPATVRDGKYPELTCSFESINVKGLYFAGTLMHGTDFARANSGFIHGFRHNISALSHILQRDRHGVAWPSRTLAKSSDFTRLILQDLLQSVPLFHQPGVLINVVDLRGEEAVYYQDVPRDYALSSLVPKQGSYLAVSLEFGKHEIPDPFDANDAPDEATIFLHPVLRYIRQGEVAGEIHLRQDLENQWDVPVNVRNLQAFLWETCRLGSPESELERRAETSGAPPC